MTTTVYFGKLDAMIAEVGAFDMGAAWFKECGYRYAVLAHDDAGTNYGTEYHATKADAKAAAKEWAKASNGKIATVY
jgi:hypothetical protein